MDAKRIEELLEEFDWLCDEARSSGGAQANGFERIDGIQSSVRTALESLQRIAELPEGWKEKAELYARSRRHGAQVGANMAERCADELQQALPEGFSNGG